MKKMKLWGWLLGLMMISALASAKPVMVKYGNDEGWKTLEVALVQEGYMKAGGDTFDTRGVSNVMYNGLTPEQQQSMPRNGFHAVNKMVNNLPERMAVSDFKKRAGTGSLQLPEIKVAQATAPAESTVVADATSIGKAIKEGREALSAMPPSSEVEELRKKLSELATKKADAVLLKDLVPLVPQVTAIKAEIKTLSGRMKKVEDGVTAINQRLDDPKTGLAMAHTKADAAHTRLDDKTNGLAAAHAKADKVSIAINDRVTGIYALNERMEAVENDQGGVMQWVAILVAALLALAALLRTFLPKGGKEKVKTVPVSEATAPGKMDDPLDFGQTPRFAKSVTPGGKPLEPAPAV